MDENQISYEEIDREIEDRAKKRRHRLPHEFFDFSELILIVAAVLLLLTAFFFRQTVVSGGSMRPTLSNGERLFISNFFYTPKQGDIIVFQVDDKIEEKCPKLEKNEAIIKRVIATEGQTISVTMGQVYIDGQPLDEPYLAVSSGEKMAPFTVSPGHIFVMGDNRNPGGSLDSRVFGEVDTRTVVGKVLFRFYPFPLFGGVD